MHRRDPLLVFVFYASLLLLTSSGRLASVDAGAELQASMRLVTTGSALSPTRPTLNPGSWKAGIDGRFHEPHDIGPVLLLAPAAWIGHVVSSRPALDDFNAPPTAASVLASLTCAVLAAAGCCALFLALGLDYGRRTAFLLSLLLPLTTLFWPYSRTAWDVLGASAAVCVFMYGVRRAVGREARTADLLLVAAAAAAAANIRFSLLPFLMLSMGALIMSTERWRRAPAISAAIGVVAAGMTPSLVYNRVRLGSVFVPANASPAMLATSNALTGHFLHNTWSLVGAPNRGLLVFAPLCLLMAGLPAVWHELSSPQRRTIAITGLAAVTYFMLIAKLRNWDGSFGWGPRLLLPILPIVMYAAIAVFAALRLRRPVALTALAAAASIWQLPAVLSDWSNAIATHGDALNRNAPLPFQHFAVWDDFLKSLAGRAVSVSPVLAADPRRVAGSHFPDLWLARLAERSGAGTAAAVIVSVVLATAIAWSLTAFLEPHVTNCPHESE